MKDFGCLLGIIIFLGYIASLFIFNNWWHQLHSDNNYAPLGIGLIIVMLITSLVAPKVMEGPK